MSDGNGELPPGWVKTTIGCVADIVTGRTPPTKEHGIPVVRQSNLAGNTVDLNNAVYVPEQFLEEYMRFTLKKGDILIGMSCSIGKLCLYDKNTVSLQNQRTGKIELKDSSLESSRFVWHFLHTAQQKLLARGKGIGVQNVSSKDIEELPLSLPPLAEQLRIVAKIEALQERSRRARVELEEVGPLLDQFRQSLLASAFRGDLTADWRAAHPDIEPASELLHRIRQERRQKWEESELAKYEAKGKKPPKDWQEKYKEPEPVDDTNLPELPEGWCWTSLDTFVEFITSGSRGWARYYSQTGPLFVRSQDINTDSLSLADTAHVSPPMGSEGIRTRIQKDDLLITITGANVAKAACVINEIDEAYVSQHVALVRPVDPNLSTYLHRWIISPENGRSQLLDNAYGNGKPGLNLNNIRNLIVAVAPQEEQKAIFERIEIALDGIVLIELMQHSSHDELAVLDQSILAKAFRGELVPQDPNDEPASVLLERIRQQREAEGVKPKGK
ncbi:MAG: restriction endonuclease subunit S [Planctomycetaceae bacterium]